MRYKPEEIAGNRSRSRFVKQTAVTAFGNIDGKLTQTNLTCRWNQPYQWLFVIFACIRGGVNPKWSVLNANTRAVYHHVRQLEIRQTKKFDVMTTRLTSYDWLNKNPGWRMWENVKANYRISVCTYLKASLGLGKGAPLSMRLRAEGVTRTVVR